MGAGNELIAKAIEQGQARPFDFLWKIILTAITMRAVTEVARLCRHFVLERL